MVGSRAGLRRRVALVAAAAVLSGGAIGVAPAIPGSVPAAAATIVVAGCAAPTSGGDWTAYGHDLANTRSQPDEHDLGTTGAATLAPAWSVQVVASAAPSVNTGALPGVTGLNGTPIVVDGCVFAGGADGFVKAVDADTGAVAWTSPQLLDPAAAGIGGVIVGSVAVAAGKVLVMVNRLGGPFAVALDERDGHVVWRSGPVSTDPAAYTNANPGVFGGVLIYGFSAAEGDPNGQGGFALIDVATGKVRKITPTIPPADQANGYAGGGIWTAPAVDPATGFAYLGAGNPSSKQMEHRNTNAILQIDLNPGPQWGEIVDAYKGNPDQYQLAALTGTPVCAASEDTPLDTFPLDDPACGQLDLDFGATPSLFDSPGGKLVGELQKSGVFHAAHADTMEGAWTAVVGAPCALCNAASPAVAGGAVLTVGTPGGVLSSLVQGTGAPNWVSPVGDGVHYGSVTAANGVVYTVDSAGFLDGFDAATGAPVLRRSISADVGQSVAGITAAGVAVARHTVYVEAGNVLVAYRPTVPPLP